LGVGDADKEPVWKRGGRAFFSRLQKRSAGAPLKRGGDKPVAVKIRAFQGDKKLSRPEGAGIGAHPRRLMPGVPGNQHPPRRPGDLIGRKVKDLFSPS